MVRSDVYGKLCKQLFRRSRLVRIDFFTFGFFSVCRNEVHYLHNILSSSWTFANYKGVNVETPSSLAFRTLMY